MIDENLLRPDIDSTTGFAYNFYLGGSFTPEWAVMGMFDGMISSEGGV